MPKPRAGIVITAAQCIADLKRVRKAHPDQPMVRTVYRAYGKYRDHHYEVHFGSFAAFMQAAGITQQPRQTSLPKAPAPPPEITPVKLLKVLEHGKKYTLEELARKLECDIKALGPQLDFLRANNYNLSQDTDGRFELSSHIPRKPPVKIDTKDYFGDDWIRFGVVADSHMASKYERNDVLEALYDVYAREGIKTVYHCGNWIDGVAPFNKHDLHCIGFGKQLDYFLANYPRRKGIETHIISGDDHEGWWVQREGINVGQSMQEHAHATGRTDLFDLGYMERDLVFKRGSGAATIRVIHAGGGSSYAISYTSQKYAESLQAGEKPAMVLVGHFHKFDWAYPREIHIVQAGCTQDQTPFMRKKRLQAMVGGCLVETKQDNRGCLVRTRVEWMPFYNKSFYKYRW